MERDKCTSDTVGINWKQLVEQEERMRLSEDVRQKYREVEKDSSYVDWIDYTARIIQPNILKAVGLKPTAANLLSLSRCPRNFSILGEVQQSSYGKLTERLSSTTYSCLFVENGIIFQFGE